MKARLGEITRDRVVETGEEFQNVPFDIVDDAGAVVDSRKIAVPLTATIQEVTTEVKAIVATFESDRKLAQESAAADALSEDARKVAEALSGTVIE
jgi:hypothetical protein